MTGYTIFQDTCSRNGSVITVIVKEELILKPTQAGSVVVGQGRTFLGMLDAFLNQIQTSISKYRPFTDHFGSNSQFTNQGQLKLTRFDTLLSIFV